MRTIYYQTIRVRSILADIIGETKVKTFFSYYAFFKDEHMFGLFKEDKFYLRIPEHRISNISWLKEEYRLYATKSGIYHKNFFYIPDDILKDPLHYREILLETLTEVAHFKNLNNKQRKQQIRSLPNLNIHIERTLRKLGINTIPELINTGEMPIFVEMIKKGIDVHPSLLFKLHCAIRNQYVYTLSEKEKREILKEADKALYEAGLRKRFNIKDDID